MLTFYPLELHQNKITTQRLDQRLPRRPACARLDVSSKYHSFFRFSWGHSEYAPRLNAWESVLRTSLARRAPRSRAEK